MKQMKLVGAALLSMGLCMSAQGKEAPATPSASPSPAKPDMGKVSYGLGVDVGHSLQRFGKDVDLNRLTKGIKDAFGNGKLEMTDQELSQVMMAFRSEFLKKQEAEMKSAGEANQKTGQAFLAANAKKEGVVTLPSGLQYKIIKAGNGAKPGDTDTVECNYRGTLVDGTEFDSSARTGKPARFKLGGVIPGWKEALKLMPVGSKWQLFVPPELAYGARGAANSIGPNSTLIFDVELLSIQPPSAPPADAK